MKFWKSQFKEHLLLKIGHIVHRHIVASFVMLLASTQANAFESGLLPGEGPKRIIPTTEEITLHRAPSRKSKVATKLKHKKGAEVKFDQVRYRTIKPESFIVKQSGSFDGVNYGVISYLSREDYSQFTGKWQTFEYAAGDTIEFLQFGAEGSGLIQFGGEVMLAEQLSWIPRENRNPLTELWIRVIYKDTKPIGWYQVEDETVRQFLPLPW